jgi:sortase A
MFERHKTKFVFGFIGLGCLLAVVLIAIKVQARYDHYENVSGDVHQNSAQLADTPIRLRIPKIGVDASIESVGLTSEGTMGDPKDPAHAAWFNLGPRPGEKGNAVIDGHYGWKNNKPAVFDDINKLTPGDKLYVEDSKGIITTFVVRQVKIYKENEDSSGIFGIGDGKPHLNLITCGGVWNTITKNYSIRIVVFTDQQM